MNDKNQIKYDNRVKYLNQFTPSPGPGYTTQGWYFYDETGVYCYGPYNSKLIVISALRKYEP